MDGYGCRERPPGFEGASGECRGNNGTHLSRGELGKRVAVLSGPGAPFSTFLEVPTPLFTRLSGAGASMTRSEGGEGALAEREATKFQVHKARAALLSRIERARASQIARRGRRSAWAAASGAMLPDCLVSVKTPNGQDLKAISLLRYWCSRSDTPSYREYCSISDCASARIRPMEQKPPRLMCFLVLVALLPACAGPSTSETGMRIGDETLKQFAAGTTTEEWLVAILGP